MKPLNFIALLAMILLAGEVCARTWYVSPSGADNVTNLRGQSPNLPFLTVTYAISQAAAGDVVFLMPGTNYGGFTVDKRLTIEGSGTNTTLGSVVTSQVAITAALSGSDMVTIRNIAFVSSRATWGHAVQISTGFVQIDNCYFQKTGSLATDDGAAIAIGTVAAGISPVITASYDLAAVNYNNLSITNNHFESEVNGIYVFDNVSLNNASTERFVIRNNVFRLSYDEAILWQEADSVITGKINNALIQNTAVVRHRVSTGSPYISIEKGNRVRLDHVSIHDSTAAGTRGSAIQVNLKFQNDVTGFKFSNFRTYRLNQSNGYALPTSSVYSLFVTANNTFLIGQSGRGPTGFPKYNTSASYSWLDTLELTNSFIQGGAGAVRTQYAISNLLFQNNNTLFSSSTTFANQALYSLRNGDYGHPSSAIFRPTGYNATTTNTFRRVSVGRAGGQGRYMHSLIAYIAGTLGNSFVTNNDRLNRPFNTSLFTSPYVASGYHLFTSGGGTSRAGTVATSSTSTQLNLVGGTIPFSFTITSSGNALDIIRGRSVGVNNTGLSMGITTPIWDNIAMANVDTSTTENGVLRTNSSDVFQAWYTNNKTGFDNAITAANNGDNIYGLPIGNFYNGSYTINANITLNLHGCERYTPNRGMSFNAITIAANNTLTLNGDLVVKGSLTIRNGAKLNLNGYALVIDSAATITYNGTGCITGSPTSAIIVKNTTSGTPAAVTLTMDQTSESTRSLEYLEVSRNSANTVTLGSALILSNYLRINRGSVTVGANTLTITNKFEVGDSTLTNPGILITNSASNLIYSGKAPLVLPSSITSINNLTFTTDADLILRGFLTVSGTLSFSGNVFLRGGTGTFTFNGPIANNTTGRFLGGSTSTDLSIGSTITGTRNIIAPSNTDLTLGRFTIGAGTNSTNISGNITANEWSFSNGSPTLSDGKFTVNVNLGRTTGTPLFSGNNCKLIVSGSATTANSIVFANSSTRCDAWR